MGRRCVYFLLVLGVGTLQYHSLFAQDITTHASPPPPQEKLPKNTNIKEIKERDYNIETGFTFQRSTWNVGMTKEELADAGFTEENLLDYRKKGNEEWVTFYDWSSPGEEIITFYFVDGRLQQWMFPPATPKEK